eukprot:202538_1
MDDNAKYSWMILCLSCTCIMFIFHLFKICEAKGFSKNKSAFSSVLSLLLIVFGIIGIAVFIISINNVPDHEFCIFAAHWGPSGYSIFKLILYSILILRFYRTFQGSCIEYNEKKLQIWITFLTIWTLGNLVGINLTTKNIEGTCDVAKPPLPVIASIALIDIVSYVTNTILFTKPLFKLNKDIKTMSDANNEKPDNKLKHLAVKQCILSMIAITSTMCSLLIVAMLNLYVVSISLDYVVSSACIILMYEWNATLIEKVCGCCYGKSNIDTKTTIQNNRESGNNNTKNNKSENKSEITDQTPVRSESCGTEGTESELGSMPTTNTSLATTYTNSGEVIINMSKASKQPELTTIHDGKELNHNDVTPCPSRRGSININQQHVVDLNTVPIGMDIGKRIEQNIANQINVQVTTPQTPLLVDGNIDDTMINYKIAAMQTQISIN